MVVLLNCVYKSGLQCRYIFARLSELSDSNYFFLGSHGSCTAYLQGLADHALNVVKAMKADGLEVSILVLNSLINAFGEDRRVVEAFSVLQFMKENVSGVFVIVCYFDLLRILILFVLLFDHAVFGNSFDESLLCSVFHIAGFEA